MKDLGTLHEIPVHARIGAYTHLTLSQMTKDQVRAVNEAKIGKKPVKVWIEDIDRIEPHFERWGDITDTSYYDAMRKLYDGN